MRQIKYDMDHSVLIPNHLIYLEGILHLPQNAKGMVLFVHGSGSSRFSARNQFVAQELQKAKLGTLLFDLLTPEEEIEDDKTAALRFNIGFLAARLGVVTDWVAQFKETKELSLGYFGASTGGAAALVCAAEKKDGISAVVSRGGRPDLAGDQLPEVKAPTLLIVGGNDGVVIDLNRAAFQKMGCEKKLEIVQGATHLFEEPGALDQVAELARDWFLCHLRR